MKDKYSFTDVLLTFRSTAAALLINTVITALMVSLLMNENQIPFGDAPFSNPAESFNIHLFGFNLQKIKAFINCHQSCFRIPFPL